MAYSNLVNATREGYRPGAATGAESQCLAQMLMEGALSKIAIARGHIQQGAVAQKSHYIHRAMMIINALRDALDVETREESVARLDALYDYMQGRLVQANLYNDTAVLDEVSRLIGAIKCDEQWLILHA